MERIDINGELLFYLLIGTVSTVIILLTLRIFTGIFVFGLFTYYATRPLYRRVKRYIDRRGLAAGVTLTLFSLPFIILLSYTGMVAAAELKALANSTNPNLITEAIRPYVNQAGELSDPLSFLGDSTSITGAIDQLIDYISVVAGFLIKVFLILIITFYFLKDGGQFRHWLNTVLPDGKGVQQFLTGVDQDFQTLFFGNILHAGLTAIVGAVAYSALSMFAPPGLPLQYPVLIGFLAGIGSLIPVIGMKIVYVPMLLLLSAQAYLLGSEYYWFPAVFFGISFVVVDTIPDFVVRPYVSGDRLHIGALMFAYIVGPLVFGWYGLFFAPILLVIVTNFVSFILPELVEGFAGDRDDFVNGQRLTEGTRVEVDGESGTVASVNHDDETVTIAYDDDDDETIPLSGIDTVDGTSN